MDIFPLVKGERKKKNSFSKRRGGKIKRIPVLKQGFFL